MIVFPGAAAVARRLRRSARDTAEGSSSMAALVVGELAYAIRHLRRRMLRRQPGPGPR